MLFNFFFQNLIIIYVRFSKIVIQVLSSYTFFVQFNGFILIVFKSDKFQLEFSANRSIAGRISSDIAIDDISLFGDECKLNNNTNFSFKNLFYNIFLK